MGQVISTKKKYEPEYDLIERAVSYRAVVDGNSKKAEEISRAREMAYLAGLSDGLATILTLRRIERFPTIWKNEEYFPVVETWAAHTFLRAIREKAKEGITESAMEEFIGAELIELIHPESLMKAEEDLHRERILNGEDEPTAEDEEWLKKYLEQAQEEADSFRALAEAAEQKAKALQKKVE